MNRILIQAPNDKRRTYGWHQEIFYTIPNTKFVQAYCPIIRDVTIENGALEICKNSHKDGLVKQSWNEPDNRVLQIIADEKKVDKLFSNVKDELSKAGKTFEDTAYFTKIYYEKLGDFKSDFEANFNCETSK